MNYSNILKQNYKFVVAVILVVTILVLAVTAFATFKYQATTKILIIQKQSGNLDAYTATKSAERSGARPRNKTP